MATMRPVIAGEGLENVFLKPGELTSLIGWLGGKDIGEGKEKGLPSHQTIVIANQ